MSTLEPQRTRWWRSRSTWSTSLSMDTSEIHLQTQKYIWNTNWERRKYLTSGKEYIEPHKTRQDKGTRGKKRTVNRTGPALGGWGNWNRGSLISQLPHGSHFFASLCPLSSTVLVLLVLKSVFIDFNYLLMTGFTELWYHLWHYQLQIFNSSPHRLNIAKLFKNLTYNKGFHFIFVIIFNGFY